MPSFTFSAAVAAGATYDPLENWNYRYLPYPALVEVIDNASAVGVTVVRTLGSDQVQQESPLTAGGTAGVIPNRLSVEPVVEKANASDLVKMFYRNTSAGPVTVNGIIQITRAAA